MKTIWVGLIGALAAVAAGCGAGDGGARPAGAPGAAAMSAPAAGAGWTPVPVETPAVKGATDFTLEPTRWVNGPPVSLAQLRGSAVLIELWHPA
jgi:hypothetical protein